MSKPSTEELDAAFEAARRSWLLIRVVIISDVSCPAPIIDRWFDACEAVLQKLEPDDPLIKGEP